MMKIVFCEGFVVFNPVCGNFVGGVVREFAVKMPT